MHYRRNIRAGLILCGMLFCACSAAHGAIAIDWFTIDGGGITFATDGGAIEVGATVGQPDAGLMTDGGSLSISGGFWYSVAQPTITAPADVTITCGDSPDPSSTGHATGSDDCDGNPTISYSDTSSGNHPTVITRTWTITDNCGNAASDDQTIAINDISPPSNLAASPSSVCSGAPVSLSGTVAAGQTIDWYDDICDGNLIGTGSPLIVHPSQTTIYYARARDPASGCVSNGCASISVTVSSTVDFVVDVAFTGVVDPDSFDRCLRFELWNCGISTTAPAQIVNQAVTFANGQSTGISFSVPCGTYTCLTVRDRLHTLRRTLTPVYSGGQYSASFTGSKALIPGNLNDDRFIDILDFSIYTTQDLTAAPGGANTTCAQTPPFRHADVNGDGMVNSIDFDFIATNFLRVHDANCCGASGLVADGDSVGGSESTYPLTSISLADLHTRGLDNLATADLNHDGVIDASDVEMYMQSIGMDVNSLNHSAQGESGGD